MRNVKPQEQPHYRFYLIFRHSMYKETHENTWHFLILERNHLVNHFPNGKGEQLHLFIILKLLYTHRYKPINIEYKCISSQYTPNIMEQLRLMILVLILTLRSNISLWLYCNNRKWKHSVNQHCLTRRVWGKYMCFCQRYNKSLTIWGEIQSHVVVKLFQHYRL